MEPVPTFSNHSNIEKDDLLWWIAYGTMSIMATIIWLGTFFKEEKGMRTWLIGWPTGLETFCQDLHYSQVVEEYLTPEWIEGTSYKGWPVWGILWVIYNLRVMVEDRKKFSISQCGRKNLHYDSTGWREADLTQDYQREVLLTLNTIQRKLSSQESKFGAIETKPRRGDWHKDIAGGTRAHGDQKESLLVTGTNRSIQV